MYFKKLENLMNLTFTFVLIQLILLIIFILNNKKYKNFRLSEIQIRNPNIYNFRFMEKKELKNIRKFFILIFRTYH